MSRYSFVRNRNVFQLVTVLGLCVAVFLLSTASAAPDADEAMPSGSIDFVAENLFSTAKGTFHEWRVIESALDREDPEASHAIVEVMLESVDTGIRRRDEHLLTADFFDIETYPVAIVRAHSLVAAGESDEGHPLYTAKFDFDLHGVKKTLEGRLQFIEGARLVVVGSLVLDRMDFGIGSAPSRWNPMSIESEVPIEFRIEF